MGRVEGGNTPPETMILYKYFPFSGYAGKPHIQHTNLEYMACPSYISDNPPISCMNNTGGGQAHSGTHTNLGGHETSTKLGDCGQKAHVTL